MGAISDCPENGGDRQVVGLIRPNPLERSRPSPIVKGTVERIALNHAFNTRSIDTAAEGQNIARLRTNHEMLVVDCTFHATRLIRSFEVAGNHSPLLLKVEIFRGG